MSVLGTILEDSSVAPFQGLLALSERASTPNSFFPLLAITALHGGMLTNVTTVTLKLAGSVRATALRCRDAYFQSTGILTCFPFPKSS